MRSKYTKAVLLLVAVFAMSAMGVASASAALPEFKLESGLKYPVKFKGKLGGSIWEEKKAETEWSYANRKSSIVGEITGPNTVSGVTLTFTEKEAPLGHSCDNSESRQGLVLTGLKARLGYISKASKTVGLMFEPAKQPIAKCTGDGVLGEEEYFGDIIAEIAPIDTKSNSLPLTFIQHNGVESPLWFEGETEKFPQTLPFTLGQWSCLLIETTEYCKYSGTEVGFSDTSNLETEKTVEIRG